MVRAFETELVRCTTAVLSHRTLEPFLDAAFTAYDACTPSAPPSCFAILVGTLDKDRALVRQVELARSVRSTDQVAAQEFQSEIVPRFGTAYDNMHRGFWCDSKDLLRIHRRADAQGMDIIGSIHLHPDWHRLGPPGEQGLRISEAPTPMDTYMFGATHWPLNMICYVERMDQLRCYTLGAWGPPDTADDAPCPPLHIQFCTN
ncbi:hypothetical protein [Streptomyces chryseus]